MWIVCSFATINVAAAAVFGGMGSMQADPDRTRVRASVLEKLPEHVRPYAAWSGMTENLEPASAFDANAAAESSVRWLRAVLSDDWRHELEAPGIAAVPRGIDDHDVTVVRLEIDGMQLRAVQTVGRIVLILRENVAREQGATENLGEYLKQVLESVLRHGKATVFLSRISVSPSAAEAVIDDRLFDKEGDPLSEDEDREISRLPQPQQSERIAELRAPRTEKLLKLDPTLPRTLVGGPANYWWGQVYAATDGSTTVIALGKGYGGKVRAFTSPAWFTRPRDGKRVPAPDPPEERVPNKGISPQP